MIQTSEIPAEGHRVSCPHCRQTLYTMFARREELVFDGYLYGDGDTVPLFHRLSDKQRQGGWHAVLSAGECPFCIAPIFSLTAAFIDAEADDEFENVYFFCNDDRGERVHLLAQRGDESWIVSLFNTHLGPMLEHEFGPFADTYGEWMGPAGVASCSQGGPWAFAIDFLVDRWDAFRAMNQLFAPSPTRPRLGKHRVVNPSPAPDSDDDFPF